MPMDIVMKLSDILRYIFENTGKTLSENFLKEQLIIRAPGLKNFQENDWKTLYAIVSHESVIQFNSAIGTAVVSFLGTSSHTVSLSNAVRMFDRQAQEELVRLALVSEWTRFKTELQSIGVNC